VIEGGGGQALVGKRMPRDKGVAGWVMTNHKPLIVNDVNVDDRYYNIIAEEVQYQTTSLLSVPMIAKGQLIGVLQVLNKMSGEQFDENDQEILTTFAAQSAIAIENARLYEGLRAEKDRILAVEEDVRKGLARDLHDGPAQLLAAILMSIEFIEKLMEKRPERVAPELKSAENLAQRALKQVRTLLFDLRPVILETQGLVPALESYAERLCDAEELDVRLTVDDEFPRLSSKAEGVIFAIVQEAINNAKKHAKANNHEIHLSPNNDTLSVTIRDDGVGFRLEEVEKTYDQRSSLGLLNMRERAAIVHGDLTIESSPGKGTTIFMTVPISANLAEPESEG
jgi:signal transduction histidine kinase